MRNISYPKCISACVALILAVVLVTSCGDGSGEPALNPEDSSELLHMALLSPSALPFGTWSVVENDNFIDPEFYPPVPVCDPMRSLQTRLAAESTARAQRRLEMEDGPAIELELVAFEDGDEAGEVIADVRPLPDEDIAKCFTEITKRNLLDSDASVTPSTASLPAPHGGIAYADDRDLGRPRGPRVMAHAEVYVWTQRNVYISVSVIGLQGVDLSGLLAEVLERTSDSVDAVLSE